jgi:hypothetical protein
MNPIRIFQFFNLLVCNFNFIYLNIYLYLMYIHLFTGMEYVHRFDY